MAGRREKLRRVGIIPEYRGFTPDGLASGDAIDMTVDELEVLRLCDLEGLNQEAVALHMGIARATVAAISSRAHRKVANALVNGRALVIEGGNIAYSPIATTTAAWPAKEVGTMRVATTYDNGNIFMHFGRSEQFKIYDIQDGKVLNEQVVGTGGTGHGALAGLLANGAAIGGAIAAIYWLLMLVGRSASSVISGKVATRTQLIVVSATAICFILIAIFTPKEITVSMPGYSVENGFEMASVPVSALFLVLCGLCTSIMWGGIFNLAVEGLGKYTAQASGIFMMMVVGGGIFPLLQQFISDAVGYMASYWLIIALLAYLLFYGLVGCKNVNKDIPVE